MRRHIGLVLLALSCSREPEQPTPVLASPTMPLADCTRVLDDAARTTVRMQRRDPHAPSYELSETVKAVRAKAGLTDLGGDTADARVARAPSGRSECDALARAPVIVITKDALRVGDTHVASLAEVMGDVVIDALARALPAAEDDGLAILQAHESTDVIVVNRVVLMCKRAGYSSLLFVVTNKSPGSAGDELEPTRQIKL